MQIILREIQHKDYKALENIIRKTWDYDKFCSPQTAAKLAKVYLNSCLANQTFTQVAVINNIPVGIIMGKNISTHKCSLKYHIKLFTSIISLFISKEGLLVYKFFNNINTIDKNLLNKTKKDYQGEVTFFAVDSNYRGKSIGKKLFKALLSYMKKQDVYDFYLFTDTSCNYSFYEYQGMKRVCYKKYSMNIHNQKSKIIFFLYEYCFKKNGLHFEPITLKNRKQAEALQVLDNQRSFIETVRECLQEADKRKCWKPVGIYVGNSLIGFAMYGFFWEYLPFGRVWLDRLLIDYHYQNKGYGKLAIIKLLKKIHNQYNCKKVYLSVFDNNKSAINLYHKIGFHFISEYDIHGERVMVYNFKDNK